MIQLPEGPERRQVTVEWMKHIIATHERDDDVFRRDFLATVILSGAKEGEFDVRQEARDYLTSLGNQRVVLLPCRSPAVLPGPYLLVGKHVRDVWRIVDDSHGTCMETLKPQSRYSPSFT